MKLILFLIDDSHTGVDVPSSLPSKEPKLVMFYVKYSIDKINLQYIIKYLYEMMSPSKHL